MFIGGMERLCSFLAPELKSLDCLGAEAPENLRIFELALVFLFIFSPARAAKRSDKSDTLIQL